jgi:putative ATP-dependent endonuclease of OLD family
LQCDRLTALVGPNGSGKSTFLRAIELFYTITPRITAEDFHNEDVETPIEITVTYTDLDADERQRFENYIQNDELSVVRVLTLTENKYHGSALQNPDFRAFREANTGAEIKLAYNALRTGAYGDLQAYTNMGAAKDNIKAWELGHQDRCVRARDDGQFFGFKQVGQGYLGKDTSFVFIPAVRDASEDAEEGRGSAITALMDLLVRRTLFEKEEIRQFRIDVQQRYGELIDPARIPELNRLATDLSGTLKMYVSDASVAVSWDIPAEIEIPPPSANVRLVEDGFPTLVSKSGHGLQRAFILSILQHLSASRLQNAPQEEPAEGGAGAAQPKQPDLILAIEEPELYQHPTRQRHFANVLLQLAGNTIPGVARKVQILYATHSPLMVGLDRFDQVRTIRKIQQEANRPKATQVVHRTLEQVAATVQEANNDGGNFTAESLRARLVTLMSPAMSEGFFADVVVLVEGEADRAVIDAAARSLDQDFNSLGIALIPCNGKSNIFTGAAIFKSFGIPLYTIWDSDSHRGETLGKCEKCQQKLDGKADPKENQRLLKLVGREPEDWPGHVLTTSACFKTNMEQTMDIEIGEELFTKLIDEARKKFVISKRKDAKKNPTVLAEVLKKAKAQGHASTTLEKMVEAILTLKDPNRQQSAQPAEPSQQATPQQASLPLAKSPGQ